MALTKYCLGDLLELTTETNANNEYGASDVRGMTITKEIIPTKADVSNTDLTKFLVVHPGEFVFNPRTHGKKIGFGYNDTDSSFLISWNNIAFRIKDSMRDKVLSEYLFFHFNRAEWDREACYRSWGSSTEVFTWEALCEMELDLPSITVQQKYVDIYNSMLANQLCYERGLEDLKLTIDALLERFKKGTKRIPLGELIIESDERNKDDAIQSVNGVNKDKRFMPSVANGADLTKYKLVRKNQFSCNLMHVGRDVAVPVALDRLHMIFSKRYFPFVKIGVYLARLNMKKACPKKNLRSYCRCQRLILLLRKARTITKLFSMPAEIKNIAKCLISSLRIQIPISLLLS